MELTSEIWITKENWKDIKKVLDKHKITYTMHYKSRDIPNVMENPDTKVMDKHIQINLAISNWFNN